MENETNTLHDFTTSHFGDTKLSKENELNESMTITPQAQDEYTTTIENLGGNR